MEEPAEVSKDNDEAGFPAPTGPQGLGQDEQMAICE